MGTTIGMCLGEAPNKTIHQIKVGTAGRPLFFGDEVMEPGHVSVGHIAGGRALLSDPGATSSYAGDTGQCSIYSMVTHTKLLAHFSESWQNVEPGT